MDAFRGIRIKFAFFVCMEIYLGVDWGTSKIGLAVADSETRLAIPMGVVKTLSGVVDEANLQGATKIILGYPVAKDGRDQDHQAINEFKLALEKETGLPVEVIDERLTSRLAIKLRHQAPGTQKHKMAASEDAIAAMLILETYLERS